MACLQPAPTLSGWPCSAHAQVGTHILAVCTKCIDFYVFQPHIGCLSYLQSAHLPCALVPEDCQYGHQTPHAVPHHENGHSATSRLQGVGQLLQDIQARCQVPCLADDASSKEEQLG